MSIGAVYKSYVTSVNHLKHINEGITEIWLAIKELRIETAKQGERISKIEGELKSRGNQ